jgi:hypothetical protein
VTLWLAGAFLLVGIAPLVRRRLAETAVAGSAIALIAFSAADPDRLIAERTLPTGAKPDGSTSRTSRG